MGEVRMEQDRKKEVIENCLNLFIAKGLSETSTRDLSGSLKLQNAGLYYYFNSRSEAVIACVEAAVLRMESKMILAALKDVDDPDRMIKNLYRHADEMAPTMRFIVQASLPKFRRYNQYDHNQRVAGSRCEIDRKFGFILCPNSTANDWHYCF